MTGIIFYISSLNHKKIEDYLLTQLAWVEIGKRLLDNRCGSSSAIESTDHHRPIKQRIIIRSFPAGWLLNGQTGSMLRVYKASPPLAELVTVQVLSL